jgi:hypothetical protein
MSNPVTSNRVGHSAPQPVWFVWFEHFISNGARTLARLELLTMLVLARFANSVTLDSWPSAALIAETLECDPTSVYRALETLKNQGLITSRTETRSGKFRTYRVEVYSLVLPQVQGRNPSTVASPHTGNSSTKYLNSQQLQNSEQEQVTLQEKTAAVKRETARTGNGEQSTKKLKNDHLRERVEEWRRDNPGDTDKALGSQAAMCARWLTSQGVRTAQGNLPCTREVLEVMQAVQVPLDG